MKIRSRSGAPIAVVIALTLGAGAAASGCEIIANFDRTKIDAGIAEDAAAYDAEYPSTDGATTADANPPAEASTGDSGIDATTGDSAVDSAVPDAGDANVVSTGDSGTDATTGDGAVDSAGSDGGDATVTDSDVADAGDDAATD